MTSSQKTTAINNIQKTNNKHSNNTRNTHIKNKYQLDINGNNKNSNNNIDKYKQVDNEAEY